MLPNFVKANVFERFEAPGESQVRPKLGPRRAQVCKMRSGSERDGIFGHRRTKMAVDLDVRRKILTNLSPKTARREPKEAPRRPEGCENRPKMAPKRAQDGPKMAQDGAKTASGS